MQWNKFLRKHSNIKKNAFWLQKNSFLFICWTCESTNIFSSKIIWNNFVEKYCGNVNFSNVISEYFYSFDDTNFKYEKSACGTPQTTWVCMDLFFFFACTHIICFFTRQYCTIPPKSTCILYGIQLKLDVFYWLLFSFIQLITRRKKKRSGKKKRTHKHTYLLSRWRVVVFFFVFVSKAWDPPKVRFSLCWCASINERRGNVKCMISPGDWMLLFLRCAAKVLRHTFRLCDIWMPNESVKETRRTK